MTFKENQKKFFIAKGHFLSQKRMGKKNFGFTLIESMIAIFIIAVGLTAVLQSFSVSLNIGSYSQKKSQAVLLAQEKIEEISAKSYHDIALGTTTEAALPSPFSAFSRTTKVAWVDSNLNETSSDTGLKKVEITVSWNSLFWKKNNEVKLFTLIAKG
ncbi:prepilin-type N-terminal cleavage/methylation domain-containing protein [bacterium]|nr:prepilin-type N-terminal cleavage/methylation domain-containing protein [bacterium]